MLCFLVNSPKMKKSFIALALIGVAGFLTFILLFNKALPQAGVDIKVTKQESNRIAIDYLEGKGVNVGSFKIATVLFGDTDAEVFLQRVWGIEKLNQELKKDKDLNLWSYETRFFKPLEKEEYLVSTNLSGQVIGLSHTIDDSVSGAKLSKDEAKKLVMDFANSELGINISEYEEKEYKDKKLDSRTDHTFQYEIPNSQIDWSENSQSKGSKRISFAVTGDKVDGYGSFVYVPEEFQREQDQTNSNGDLYQIIALFFALILGILAIITLFIKYKKDDLRPRYFLIIVAFLITLTIIGLVNAGLDNIYFSYETTVPWSNFITMSVIVFVITLGLLPLAMLIMGLSGESLTREIYPSSNTFDSHTKYEPRKMLISTIEGVFIGFALLGYIAIFYYLGSKYLDIWSPVSPNLDDYMSHYLPFLFPILISFEAAISEEFAFRFLGVSAIKKYLRVTFLALLVPAVIWAFLHSTYAVYPMHIRGIELTIVGIILGLVFLKRNIVTVISTHYTFNAVLFSVPMFLSQKYFLKASSIVPILAVLLIPLFYFLLSHSRKRISH